jgi:CDP-4-dehydro-6-deoxyglucose reductase, E3
MQSFRSKVSRVRDLTHDVRELELTLCEPKEIAFLAGQFISFEVLKEGRPYPVTRAYSIASPPSTTDKVVLLFNLVPGPGSVYLFSLQEGDEVRFKGPAGAFHLRDDPGKRLLFVATGTGIAPFRSMILSRLERNRNQLLILFWGVRSERDLYYQDEFQDLAARHPQFSFVTTLSQAGPDWIGARGRVSSLVQERVTSVHDLAVYLCGNGQMIKDVTAMIQAKGLCPIYREKYY